MRALRPLLLLVLPLVRAEAPPAPSPAERLADGRVRLGLVVVDPAARTATLPALLNQTHGVIEYALVHETGKTHESLLRTAAGALDLHAAALLLDVPPAGPAAVTNAAAPAASAVEISVARTNAAGAVITRPLQEWIELRQDEARRTRAGFPPPRWLYNGSLLTAEGFAAHFEGSLVSLIRDPAALVNSLAPSAGDDDIHFPAAAGLPATNTPVAVVLHFPAPAAP